MDEDQIGRAVHQSIELQSIRVNSQPYQSVESVQHGFIRYVLP